MKVEICANSYESARAAQSGGADRIELCSALALGGLTPSYGLIKKVLSDLEIPVHVLVRPRSGNFTYTEEELEVMLQDIHFCKAAGCGGIVSGALKQDASIDLDTTEKLVAAAQGLHFTFHRAFDWCENPHTALEDLQKLEVQRVLTSGQEQKAVDGIELLKKLKDLGRGSIEIMPGSGISVKNILDFKQAGFSSVHLSASEKISTLIEKPKIPMHSPDLLDERYIKQSSLAKIRRIINILKA